MKRLLQATAALLLAGIAHAQISQPTAIRPGDILGPWSETCITGITVDGVQFAIVQPGETLRFPEVPPSFCGLTITICHYVVCGTTVTEQGCDDYTITC